MPKEKELSIPEGKTVYTYTAYASYLRRRYGAKVYRVGVDGGFSCPNRGTLRTHPGCSYCDSFGSLSAYQRIPGSTDLPGDMDDRLAWIGKQIGRGIAFLKGRYSAEYFILYFQAFSNTFDSLANLKRIYDFGLSRHPFIEFAVSTRPDCIDPRRADLLASYKTDQRDVWVELGLQSSDDATLRRIRRGHDRLCFERAFGMLKERGIKTAVHLIFGLPGEGWTEIEKTIGYIRDLKPEGLKLHNLHVPEGTAMASEYRRGELTVPSMRRHLDYVIRALELLPDDIIIMRMTCDTPSGRLLVPRKGMKKAEFYSRIRHEMKRRCTFQGRRFAGQ